MTKLVSMITRIPPKYATESRRSTASICGVRDSSRASLNILTMAHVNKMLSNASIGTQYDHIYEPGIVTTEQGGNGGGFIIAVKYHNQSTHRNNLSAWCLRIIRATMGPRTIVSTMICVTRAVKRRMSRTLLQLYMAYSRRIRMAGKA